MRQISLSDMISQISESLDAVEAGLLGATPFHAKRIAAFSLAVGRHLGYDTNRLFDLAGCALLHDNALTEYILSEKPGSSQKMNMKSHCIIGQDNASHFPFPASIDGFILYHHENVDGTGAFGKKEGEYPQEAAIIALTDQVDVRFALQKLTASDLKRVESFIRAGIGNRFGRREAQAALAVLDENLLSSLTDENISDTLRRELPRVQGCINDSNLVNMSAIVARIIDYKSTFTQLHSTQIANKAWYMGGVYRYGRKQQIELYTAAAMHDIGKLFIPTQILEKPGRLTDDEFEIIKSHVQRTWDVLHSVQGFDEIASWASNHHEKLDGSGYPRGITAPDLDFNSRLLACLDIYQAVRESRPYHPARTHEDTMEILRDMAHRGQVDASIVGDLDRSLAGLKDGYAAPPPIG